MEETCKSSCNLCPSTVPATDLAPTNSDLEHNLAALEKKLAEGQGTVNPDAKVQTLVSKGCLRCLTPLLRTGVFVTVMWAASFRSTLTDRLLSFFLAGCPGIAPGLSTSTTSDPTPAASPGTGEGKVL
jgi:hypothetical protein